MNVIASTRPPAPASTAFKVGNLNGKLLDKVAA